MKIKGLRNIIPGVDEMDVIEFITGEVFNIAVTIRDEDNNPVDLTGHTYFCRLSPYRSTVTVTGRGDAECLNLSNVMGNAGSPTILTVTPATDPTTGVVNIAITTAAFIGIPAGDLNATEDVLTPFVFLRVTGNGVTRIYVQSLVVRAAP